MYKWAYHKLSRLSGVLLQDHFVFHLPCLFRSCQWRRKDVHLPSIFTFIYYQFSNGYLFVVQLLEWEMDPVQSLWWWW